MFTILLYLLRQKLGGSISNKYWFANIFWGIHFLSKLISFKLNPHFKGFNFVFNFNLISLWRHALTGLSITLATTFTYQVFMKKISFSCSLWHKSHLNWPWWPSRLSCQQCSNTIEGWRPRFESLLRITISIAQS